MTAGVLEAAAATLLRDFFRMRRAAPAAHT